MSDVAPRIFMSHASEDKAEYAEPLARELMNRGVDVWLDKWEMRPGDSLVQKIFEEGLGTAKGMVIVLSHASIAKPWVRAELDTGVVRRIEGSARLIPVVVDDCAVPESLRSTLWIDLRREGTIHAVATKIANAIFGRTEKPLVGSPPAFASIATILLPGTTAADMTVLYALYEAALSGERRLLLYTTIADEMAAAGIDSDSLMESVDVLVTTGYLRSKHYNGSEGHYAVELSAQTLLRVAETKGVDVDSCRKQMASLILNEDVCTLSELSEKTGVGQGIIEAIADQFVTNGFLKLARGISFAEVHGLTPSFRRWLVNSQ